MKYVSPEYRKQLDDLAEMLMKPIGDIALDNVVEIDEIIDHYPPNLRLLSPPERGWENIKPGGAA